MLTYGQARNNRILISTVKNGRRTPICGVRPAIKLIGYFQTARFKALIIPEPGISNVLAEFDKVNGILTGDSLGIKSPKAKECFTAHIRSQPVAVAVFANIPEVFLFHANAVDGFNQAAGKKIALAAAPPLYSP
jgi:hypothetical protein